MQASALSQVMSLSSSITQSIMILAVLGQLRETLGTACSGTYTSASDVLQDGCTSITGDLTVSDSGDISLPGLRSISGKLEIQNVSCAIDFACCRSCQDYLASCV